MTPIFCGFSSAFLATPPVGIQMKKTLDKSGVLSFLGGGDLRSIGGSDEVAMKVLTKPELFGALFDGMTHGDPVIRARSADAVEKITRTRPDLLEPFKKRLLTEIASIPQQEVRWHVAQMIPRLALSPRERDMAVKLLLGWVDSEKSRIVKTFSLQALADISKDDDTVKKAAMEKLKEAVNGGVPSMAARARKLLKEFDG